MIYTPKSFSFIDDNLPKNTNKEKYAKYFNMLKKGVPLFAVKQKLIIDKLNPNILDNPNDIIIDNNNNNNNKSMLLNSILSRNFKLKETTTTNNNNKKQYKSKSLLVPSKEDIINAMNNLKKY